MADVAAAALLESGTQKMAMSKGLANGQIIPKTSMQLHTKTSIIPSLKSAYIMSILGNLGQQGWKQNLWIPVIAVTFRKKNDKDSYAKIST